MPRPHELPPAVRHPDPAGRWDQRTGRRTGPERWADPLAEPLPGERVRNPILDTADVAHRYPCVAALEGWRWWQVPGAGILYGHHWTPERMVSLYVHTEHDAVLVHNGSSEQHGALAELVDSALRLGTIG